MFNCQLSPCSAISFTAFTCPPVIPASPWTPSEITPLRLPANDVPVDVLTHTYTLKHTHKFSLRNKFVFGLHHLNC